MVLDMRTGPRGRGGMPTASTVPVHPVVEWLRDERVRRGWGQRAVAPLLHVSVSTVSEMERGLLIPRLDVLTQWLALFGMHLALTAIPPEEVSCPPST